MNTRYLTNAKHSNVYRFLAIACLVTLLTSQMTVAMPVKADGEDYPPTLTGTDDTSSLPLQQGMILETDQVAIASPSLPTDISPSSEVREDHAIILGEEIQNNEAVKDKQPIPPDSIKIVPMMGDSPLSHSDEDKLPGNEQSGGPQLAGWAS